MLLLVLFGTIIVSIFLYVHLRSALPYPHTIKNAAYHYLPTYLYPLAEMILGRPSPKYPPPRIHQELLAAPPLESWPTPSLGDGSAFLFLHIFSTSSESSRKRRTLIRQHSPLEVIPEEYRSLIEIKFILGRPTTVELADPVVGEEEKEIEMEMKEYGDIVRLNGLFNGENKHNGKSYAWAQWVGSQGGRQAQWVFKCDDSGSIVLNTLLFLLNPGKTID